MFDLADAGRAGQVHFAVLEVLLLDQEADAQNGCLQSVTIDDGRITDGRLRIDLIDLIRYDTISAGFRSIRWTLPFFFHPIFPPHHPPPQGSSIRTVRILNGWND